MDGYKRASSAFAVARGLMSFAPKFSCRGDVSRFVVNTFIVLTRSLYTLL